ncbi:MAG: hypothetical protein WC881_01935 [Elusimicrobiota bacterium]
MRKTISRALAAVLVACIALLSPGPDALAAVIRAAAPAQGAPIGRILAPISGAAPLAGLAPVLSLTPGLAPASLVPQGLPAVRVSAWSVSAQNAPAAPAAAAIRSELSAPIAAAPAAPQSSLQTLRSGVESIRQTEAPA